MSLKTRERVRPLRVFFSGPVDLFFMSLKTRERIKTLTGLFFTIIKIEGFVSYVFLVETIQSLLILMTFF